MAAVPVAVVAMLAASGYRVPVFWYQSGQHHEIADGDAGRWVEVSERTSDAHGDLTRRYSVRLDGLGGAQSEYVAGFDAFTLPEGMVARTVRLDFRAAPDQVLKACALTLVDDRGRQYRVGHVADRLHVLLRGRSAGRGRRRNMRSGAVVLSAGDGGQRARGCAP